MAENADLVAQFCGITGAAAHVAENYLLAHEWNLERAVDFYLEHPPQHAAGEVDDAFHDALPAFETEQGQHPTSATAAQPDVVEIPDDEQLPAGRQDDLLELARQRNRAVAARRQAEQQEDDMAEEMCRRAGISTPPDGLEVRGRRLAAAVNGHAAGPRTRSQPGPGLAVAAELDLMEYHSMDEDDDIEPPPLVGPSSSTDLSRLRELGQTYHQQQQQQLFEHYHRLAQQQQQDAAAEMFYGDADAAAAEAATAAESGVGVVGTGNGSAVPDIELPEGINLEEARMLEAAMLGIPYEGSIPDFRRDEVATATAAAPLSPETMEQRSLRAEQDAAYEESLALDRYMLVSTTCTRDMDNYGSCCPTTHTILQSNLRSGSWTSTISSGITANCQALTLWI
eukprot:GHRR01012357.1.p1 GENE.GHRR01012357.1~~GHRR01012357.1.p1  ORF type:complete len:434 (+),score=172.34 GHRR01012357.1:113-1303(+)